MKILHTADWHIGKKLYKYDLNTDFDLFIKWLVALVGQEKIDLLLISGDVFDTGNPSSESRRQFYNALIELQQKNCKIIVTGGNHDSPTMLNAPKEVLNEINVKVIGGMPDDIADCIFPIKNKNNEPELVVCAIPYLRDADLRKATDGFSYEDRIKAVQNGIENTFKNASDFCEKNYPHLPKIAMGHLFTAGASATPDSERDIQVGNEAKFDAHRLGNNFDYVALGHIHKPQRVSAEKPTFYSGSPLPLSFSERKDEKRVLLIDTALGFEPKSIPIPNFRKLIRISGTLNDIEFELNHLNEKLQLKSLLEIEMIEDNYSAEIEDVFNHLMIDFKNDDYEIVKTKIHWKDRVLGTSELYAEQENLADLQPKDVFSKLLDTQELNEEVKAELNQAFNLLLEEVLAEN